MKIDAFGSSKMLKYFFEIEQEDILHVINAFSGNWIHFKSLPCINAVIFISCRILNKFIVAATISNRFYESIWFEKIKTVFATQTIKSYPKAFFDYFTKKL